MEYSIQRIRASPYLSYITIIKNIYDSNYDGLQMSLTGRNYHGLSFTAAYSFSHALGDASDQGTSANFPVPLNSYGNIRQQLYANTDFDIRHRFTLSLDYAIPGRKGFGQLLEGWSVNTIVIVTSGLPWGLSDQSDDFSGTNVIGTGSAKRGRAVELLRQSQVISLRFTAGRTPTADGKTAEADFPTPEPTQPAPS